MAKEDEGDKGSGQGPAADKSDVVVAAAAGGVAGGAGLLVGGPAYIAWLGFGAEGIAAGSAAAGIMSAEAVAAGGGLAAGGVTATLQSIGAVGMPAGLAAGVAAVGCLLGAGIFGGIYYAISSNTRSLSNQLAGRRGAKKGKWMVLMEEGIGNVVHYPFDSEHEARAFFSLVARERPSRPRILFDPSGHEVDAGSWNPLALPTIRSAHMGIVSLCGTSSKQGFLALAPGAVVGLLCNSHQRYLRVLQDRVVDGDTKEDATGHWLVVTEEGFGNVQVYPFMSEHAAWGYFNAPHRVLFIARVLYRPHYGAYVEVASGGINSAALGTIRRHMAAHPPAFTSSGLFTVVDAGRGEIALHAGSVLPGHFVRMMGADVECRGGLRAVDALPAEWHSECWTVVDAGGGLVALHSAKHNCFLRVDPKGGVNSHGGERDADSLPDAWDSERFVVVPA